MRKLDCAHNAVAIIQLTRLSTTNLKSIVLLYILTYDGFLRSFKDNEILRGNRYMPTIEGTSARLYGIMSDLYLEPTGNVNLG